MSSPSVLHKLGDTASKYASGLKTLAPGESEMAGIKATQQNVDDATAKAKPAPVQKDVPNLLHPLAKYGDNPGEKRLDSEGNVIPTYDNGGDVSVAAGRKAQAKGDADVQSLLSGPDDTPMRSEAPVAPPTSAVASKPKPTDNATAPQYMQPTNDQLNPGDVAAPSQASVVGQSAGLPVMKFDQGGDVDVNDGQHQLAVLKDGEKVLNTKEADAYRAGQKSTEETPQDIYIGGPKHIPNPDNVQPVLDTDINKTKPTDTDHLVGSGKTSIDNAPLENPKGDISNPEAVNLRAGLEGKEIGAKGEKIPAGDDTRGPQPTAKDSRESVAGQVAAKPFGQLVDEKADEKAKETANAQSQATPAPEEKPKTTYGNILANQWMKSNGMNPGSMEQGSAMPGAQPKSSPYGNVEQGAAKPQALQTGAVPARPGMKPIVTPAASNGAAPNAETAHAPTNPAEYKTKIADMKAQRQQALEDFSKSGDPKDELRADATSRALMEYQKANPWGSPLNHPGILGKIGHYGSMVGNIAGNIAAPGVMMNVPGTELNKKAQAQGVEKRIEAEVPEITKREAAEMETEGKPLTNPEAVYKSLMTPDASGKLPINPDTDTPWTAQEANVAAQGTGKTTEELYVQEGMKGIDPATGKHYTRQQQENKYLREKAGTKSPNEEEIRVNDYITKRGQEATPANREAARTALKASDTVATQQAALPFAEQKAKFNDNLATTRALLVQQNADANQRGLKSDELQNIENVRSAGVMTKLTTAKDALNAPEDQFANQIAPVVSLLAVTSAEGVKRVNKQELDKFVPTSGSLGRWIEGHADQFLDGKIPADYREEVGHMLDRMSAAEDVEHKINSQSIDNTVRQGAQQPVQKPEGGGAQAKPAPSKPTVTPEVPKDVPKTATHVYRDKANKVVGYAEGGQYHSLSDKK